MKSFRTKKKPMYPKVTKEMKTIRTKLNKKEDQLLDRPTFPSMYGGKKKEKKSSSNDLY